MDPEHWPQMGMTPEAHANFAADEREVDAHGIQAMKTCTPYLAGNMPKFGEHCAWMESSAVVFCNSVVGGRTNTEGRESTSAAMLAKRVPDWGFHQTDFRYGQHLVDVQVPVGDIFEWGMLGYFVGGEVQDAIPVIDGQVSGANLIRHKHFGAAAASSGGVELYHMVGITPEARSLEAAFGPRSPPSGLSTTPQPAGAPTRRSTRWARPVTWTSSCWAGPHASLEQLAEVAACSKAAGYRPTAPFGYSPREP